MLTATEKAKSDSTQISAPARASLVLEGDSGPMSLYRIDDNALEPVPATSFHTEACRSARTFSRSSSTSPAPSAATCSSSRRSSRTGRTALGGSICWRSMRTGPSPSSNSSATKTLGRWSFRRCGTPPWSRISPSSNWWKLIRDLATRRVSLATPQAGSTNSSAKRSESRRPPDREAANHPRRA